MENFEKNIKTLLGTMNLSYDESGFIRIAFEGTDAVLCVYPDNLSGTFKVAYIPLPDGDRTPDMYERDVRFSIEKTNVAEYVAKGGVFE